MVKLADRNNPNFILLACNNRNTSWRPFGLPIILVVPHVRDSLNNPIANALPINLRITIEGVPHEALVAGPEHVGLRFPDQELFRKTLTFQDMMSHLIDNIALLQFRNQDGTIGDITTVLPGDSFIFKTASGITDDVQWFPDASYFDLSDIMIDTEQLLPRHYALVYSADYYVRIVLDEGFVDPVTNLEVQELLCLDISTLGLAEFRFELNHPGEVLEDMYRLTPPRYLDNANKALETTASFYRPFSNILQDIYDEQHFLARSNWVYNVPYAAIPYLSAQLGWDIPYYPKSVDNLRRAVLRETVRLQKLKGSRLAVIELMALFGFEILINHLWSSTDGKILIEPNAKLPPLYADQQINHLPSFQFEPLLAGYTTSGYGEIAIPLLFQPQELSGLDPFKTVSASADITLEAYLVDRGSQADLALTALVQSLNLSPDQYNSLPLTVDKDGFLQTPLPAIVTGLPLNGYSKLLITAGQANVLVTTGATPPLSKTGVNLDKANNTVNLTFDGYLDLSTQSLYVFASYIRWDLNVPPKLADLYTNRFNIQLLTTADGTLAPADVLDFLIDFISKVKAFHSILNTVKYRFELDESFLVTDMCVGGNVLQRYDTAIGRQQVPQAIMPKTPGVNCLDQTPVGIGYKPEDLLYRRRVLLALLEEWVAYKALDGRSQTLVAGLLLAVLPAQGQSCQYTTYGQDRTTASKQLSESVELSPLAMASQSSAAAENNIDLSPAGPAQSVYKDGKASSNSHSSNFGFVQVQRDKPRPSLCLQDNITDYCYKGRVADELLFRLTLPPQETYQASPCGLTMGNGVYWTYPVPVNQITNVAGVDIMSGGGQDSDGNKNLAIADQNGQSKNLTVTYSDPLPADCMSWLGRISRAYDTPTDFTIHYDNRPYLEDPRQAYQLALLRPNLNIKKPTMHLPGCRFPTMNKLVKTFIHQQWRAKPWDDEFTVDIPAYNGQPGWLNAQLVPIKGGSDLVYQDVPYQVPGNGLEADISSLGAHSVPSYMKAGDAIHRIYSAQVTGNPAITFDQLDQGSGQVTISASLFNSATSGVGGQTDYIDGYASASGFVGFGGADLDRGGIYHDLFVALAIPRSGIDETGLVGTALGTGSVQLLFLAGSGIRVERGVRLDCGCLLSPHSSPTTQVPTCSLNLYSDQRGVHDFSGDQIWTFPHLVADETIGGSGWLLDGSIPSLLEIHQ